MTVRDVLPTEEERVAATAREVDASFERDPGRADERAALTSAFLRRRVLAELASRNGGS